MRDCVTQAKLETIHRTPNASCPGCSHMRQHTAEEMRKFHPHAGHGFTPEGGWTHPELQGQR